MSEEDLQRLLRASGEMKNAGRTEMAVDTLSQGLAVFARGNLKSAPPQGCLRVTNLYVEIVDGNPKLRVEYEE